MVLFYPKSQEEGMISQTAQYALRAIVCLASKAETPTTTERLAALTKVPVNYLSKVMQTLARGNLVTSRPGKSGGYLLKQPPEAISLLMVIEAIDPLLQPEPCHVEIQGYGNVLKPLQQKLAQINALVRNECRNVYIKDLL